MRVRIELELDEECIDEDSPTGMTEAAYERLADELNGYGFDIEIAAVE